MDPNPQCLQWIPMHSVYNGSQSKSYLRPKIWELFPLEIKTTESLAVFKKKLRNGNLMTSPVDSTKFSFSFCAVVD